MNDIRQQIIQCLSGINIQSFELEDQSHLHIGHAGSRAGGGHYVLKLVSEDFSGLSRLQRQRMIQDKLTPLFVSKYIHALSLSTLTPKEYAQQLSHTTQDKHS